jgi:hypothetical protein
MSPRSSAQYERDAALIRIGRARRWAVAGAAGLTAAFAAVVTALAPGRSSAHAAEVRTGSAATSTSAVKPGTTAQLPPLENAARLGLQAPGQPPQAAPADPSQSSAGANPSQSTASADPSQSSAGANPSQSSAGSPDAQAAAQSAPPVVSGGS